MRGRRGNQAPLRALPTRLLLSRLSTVLLLFVLCAILRSTMGQSRSYKDHNVGQLHHNTVCSFNITGSKLTVESIHCYGQPFELWFNGKWWYSEESPVFSKWKPINKTGNLTSVRCLMGVSGHFQVLIEHSFITWLDLEGVDAIFCIVGSSQVTLRKCLVAHNVVAKDFMTLGNAIYAGGTSTVVISDSTISSNYATGIMVTDAASVNLTGTMVSKNGGKVITETFDDWRTQGPEVYEGGGAAVANGTLRILNNTTFQENVASFSGGGVHVRDTGSLLVSESHFVRNQLDAGCVVCLGGAIAVEVKKGVHEFQALVDVSGSTFIENFSSGSAGAIAAYVDFVGASDLASDRYIAADIYGNSKFLGNRAEKFGGALYLGQGVQHRLHNCTLQGNRAVYGGAIYANRLEQTNLIAMCHSRLLYNVADYGGAVYGSIFLSAGNVIAGNKANNDGGGIYIPLPSDANQESSTYDAVCDRWWDRNSAGPIVYEGVFSKIVNNTAGLSGGGVFVSSPDQIIGLSDLLNASHVHGNKALVGPDTTLPPHDMTMLSNPPSSVECDFRMHQGCLPFSVNVTAHYNWDEFSAFPVAGVRVEVHGLLGHRLWNIAPEASALQVSNADGVANFSSFKFYAAPGYHTFFVSAIDYPVIPKLNFTVLVTKCSTGSVPIESGNACQPCPVNSYNIDAASGVCSPCPIQIANCTGGATLLPLAGYWRSSNVSTQIHRCANPTACDHPSDGTGIEAFGGSMDWQCAKGYHSNLCGVCADKGLARYAWAGAFTCKECGSRAVTAGMYVAAVLLMLTWCCWVSTQTYHDNKGDAVQTRPADVSRVLLLYLQYMIVLNSVTTDWPLAYSGFDKLLSWLFAAASSRLYSLECVFGGGHQRLPVAVERLLISIITPLTVCAVVLVLMMLAHADVQHCIRYGPRHPQALADRAVVTILTVVYGTFYVFLVKASLAFFACYHLDAPALGSNPDAIGRFWVYDMRQRCWEGWHLQWALGLGLSCVLLFGIGVPVGVISIMFSRRFSQRSAFKVRYGSLYRNYTPRCSYWEGCIAAQTMVLATASVFGRLLGVVAHLYLLIILFVSFLVAHVSYKPFRDARLQTLQLAGYVCCLATACIAETFESTGPLWQPPDLYKQVMGCLLLVLNVAYIFWTLYCMYHAGKAHLSAWCSRFCSCSHAA